MTLSEKVAAMVSHYRKVTGAESMLVRGAPGAFTGAVLLALAMIPGVRWSEDPEYPAGRITVEEERRRRPR